MNINNNGKSSNNSSNNSNNLKHVGYNSFHQAANTTANVEGDHNNSFSNLDSKLLNNNRTDANIKS